MAPQETSFAHIHNNTHRCWSKDPCLRRNVVHLLGISLCVYYLGCRFAALSLAVLTIQTTRTS